MPAVSTIVAVAGLAVGLAGAATSFVMQQKAAKEQKKARREQQNQEQNVIRRRRRQAIREAQIKRAQILNFSEGTGTGGSSAPAGAVSSIRSQFGNASGEGTMISSSNAKIGMHMQKSADFEGFAGIASGISNLGFSAASFGMGMGGGSTGMSPDLKVGSGTRGTFLGNYSFGNYTPAQSFSFG